MGPASLVLSVAGIKYQPFAATIVSIEISQPVGKIVVGEKNEMFVRVAGTDQKVILSVENRAPDVLELTDGNFHWVMSSGGTLNEATIGMRASRRRRFFCQCAHRGRRWHHRSEF